MAEIARHHTGTERLQVWRGVRWTARVMVIGSAVVALAACGSSLASSTTAAKGAVPATPGAAGGGGKTVNVDLIGKTDADSSDPGTSTGKDHWPAMSPSQIQVASGATVVLTIKEYDDAPTALPDNSPYNNVAGGTETVNGAQVTTVGNDQIAHTITIPALGINIPLPKAPKGGFTTIQFTFKAPAAGTYQWQCMTPCGDDPNGMGGAMEADGWMRGHLVVS